MEIKKPTIKKHVLNRVSNLPPDGSSVLGIFNGLNVVIDNQVFMIRIYENGSFGKGNLSKSFPEYNNKKNDIPRVLWEQQFNIESKWHFPENGGKLGPQAFKMYDMHLSYLSIDDFFKFCMSKNALKQIKFHTRNREIMTEADTMKKFSNNLLRKFICSDLESGCSKDENFIKIVNKILASKKLKKMEISQINEEKIIVVSCNSNSCFNNNYIMGNITAKLKIRPFPFQETLNLSLIESYYLNCALDCLKIHDIKNRELLPHEIWKNFSALEVNFFEKFVIYHYYRSKGWIIHSGLKYGGDYLLYKNGPVYNHASYVVKILYKNQILLWKEFLATNRLVETFNKDVLYCMVYEKSSHNEEMTILDRLNNSRVFEIMSRRWY